MSIYSNYPLLIKIRTFTSASTVIRPLFRLPILKNTTEGLIPPKTSKKITPPKRISKEL